MDVAWALKACHGSLATVADCLRVWQPKVAQRAPVASMLHQPQVPYLFSGSASGDRFQSVSGCCMIEFTRGYEV